MSGRIVAGIVILGLLATTAGADRSRRPHGDATVVGMLERAAASYEEGRLERAIHQVHRAEEMIALELDEVVLPEPVPLRSNAVQLLMHLDLYRVFALGSDPDHDEAWSFLTETLSMVAHAESWPDPPDQMRGQLVSTWGDGQVYSIGGVVISHWGGGQINSVGQYTISYHADGQIQQIGGIHYQYHAGDERPHQVGKINFR